MLCNKSVQTEEVVPQISYSILRIPILYDPPPIGAPDDPQNKGVLRNKSVGPHVH